MVTTNLADECANYMIIVVYGELHRNFAVVSNRHVEDIARNIRVEVLDFGSDVSRGSCPALISVAWVVIVKPRYTKMEIVSFHYVPIMPSNF